MSRLRARCPDCRTLTAVAIGPEYQCHSCGREFRAGLVRVTGDVELAVAYPEAAVVALDEDDLERVLPERPLVLGGDSSLHARVAAALSAEVVSAAPVSGAAGIYVLVEADLVASDVAALERQLRDLATQAPVVGAGFIGLSNDPLNASLVERLAAALGL